MSDEVAKVQATRAAVRALMLLGQGEQAVEKAKEVRTLLEELEDETGTAYACHDLGLAHLVADQHDEAITIAQEVTEMWQDIEDRDAEAAAMQLATRAHLQIQNRDEEQQKAALSAAQDTTEVYADEEDKHGEATMLLITAAIHMSGAQKNARSALQCAEQARTLFQEIGEKQSQASASYVVARANQELNNFSAAAIAAQQAHVLAKQTGDSWTQANAGFALSVAFQNQGRLKDALRAAGGAQTLFRELGLDSSSQEAENLYESCQELLPGQGERPPMALQFMPPVDSFRAMKGALWQDAAQIVIWSKPFNDCAYVGYCLELLNFVNDIIKNASRTSVIVATRGVWARDLGEPINNHVKGTQAKSVWAVVRSVKLELPRLHISTVDVPMHATGKEIAHCFQEAIGNGGENGELAYMMDRPFAAKLEKERLEKQDEDVSGEVDNA